MPHTGLQHVPWKFLLTVFFVLAVVTTAVPVTNVLRRPAGTQYTGYTYESVGDIFFYLNLIEQAKRGNVLFQNFMTPEQHKPALFHPLFLLLGWFARVARLGELAVWHVARVLFLVPFLVVLYTFIAKLFSDEHQRRFVLLFTLCSGGIWLATHESSLFVSLLYSPMSILTLLNTYLFFLLFLRHYQHGLRFGTSACVVLLGLFQATLHPYGLLLWGAIPLTFVFVDVLLQRTRLRFAAQQALPVILALGAGYGYLFFFVLSNPMLRAWSEGAVIQQWHWVHVVLFFGALLLLVPLGIVVRRKEIWKSDQQRFLLVWLFVNFYFARSSYPYAGRLMIFLFLPLGIFASYGVLWIWQNTRRNSIVRYGLPFLLALSISNNVYHLYINISGKYFDWQQQYISQQDLRVTAWLRSQGKPSDVVLAAPSWDTLFAQLAYHQVFITYGGLTNNFYRRLFQALSIYGGRYNSTDLLALLKENSIRYVVLSPRERASGYTEAIKFQDPMYSTKYGFNFQPEQYPFLRLAYNQDGYAVYEVSDTLAQRGQ